LDAAAYYLKSRAAMEAHQLAQPPKIRVVVRKRPLTQREVKRGEQDTLVIRTPNNLVVQELK